MTTCPYCAHTAVTIPWRHWALETALTVLVASVIAVVRLGDAITGYKPQHTTGNKR